MFAAAYSQATGFTRPVIMSRRRVDGSCDSGIGSFVVVNNEGWIITAAHIVREYGILTEAKQKVLQFRDAQAAIQNDNSLLSNQKRKRLRKLGPVDPKGITDFSFWWGADGIGLKDAMVLGDGTGDPILTGDIAVGRLEPFDPASIPNYPQFKDASKPIASGTSLCRLGFPFHGITPTFANGNFTLPPGTFPLVFFPNEGILTRVLVMNPDPANFVAFIETSSPGLMGQSGGPIFDQHGTVWGIQSHTSSLPLGFSPPTPGGKPGEKEHQFLNIGRGAHPATIARLLDAAKAKYG